MHSFAPYLDVAIQAARAAGDLLRADFHRAGGPRGKGDKAPADTEAEQVIRAILLGRTPDWGFLGEETGRIPCAAGKPVWVVDPNDGTRDYIRGRRGSSVSIAVVFERRPVLGVVHAFNWPDDAGAIYAAAEGREGIFKNGAPIVPRFPDSLSSLDVVLVSGGGDRAARANLKCTKPARIMAIPSIAHRLAKVAAGEASATNSLYSPKSWDFAAGHSLIRAAGGALVDENGAEPVYDGEANGTAPRLFASSSAVANELRRRPWDDAFRAEREASAPVIRLAPGAAYADPARLSRAQGAFLGQLAGSALGAVFSGREDGATSISRDTFAAAALDRRLMAGQLGTFGEVQIAAARAWLERGSDARTLIDTYASWASSSPTEPDRAIRAAGSGHPAAHSTGPSALARVVTLTLWRHDADIPTLARTIDADTALTHPSVFAREVAQLFAILLQTLVRDGNAHGAIQAAQVFARRSGFSRDAIQVVAPDAAEAAAARPRREGETDAAGVLATALGHIARGRSFEDALESTVAGHPGTDAAAAITGALIGASAGRDAIPEWLRLLVLSSRPLDGFAPQPRPAIYWATDAFAIAESLLTSR